MTTPQKTIIDCITGTTITRDFNETELAQWEANQAQADIDAQAKIKADQLLADKRQIILDRLGITYDEFKTILS